MRVKNSTAIFVEEQPADSAYFVLKGKVLIGRYTDGVPNTGKDAVFPKPDIELAVIGKGQLFGEYALILGDGSSRTATAYALEDVELEQVTRGEFERRVNALDPFMRQYLRTLIDQVVETSKKVNTPSVET